MDRPTRIQRWSTNPNSQTLAARHSSVGLSKRLGRAEHTRALSPEPDLEEADAHRSGCRPHSPVEPLVPAGLETLSHGLSTPDAHGGQALDPAVRVDMEARFGHDFSTIRIFSDAEAAQAVSARAFTVGQTIVFGAGEYAPATVAGRRLLAHELAHTIQQRDAASASAPFLSSDGQLEQEASRAAASAVEASLVAPQVTLRAGMSLQRDGTPAASPTPAGTKLLKSFAAKFPDAAKLIQSNPEAMKLVAEAEAAGAKFGGYAETDSPYPKDRAHTIAAKHTLYVPKTHTDAVLAMRDFLFELNNAVRAPKFVALQSEAAKGSKGKLTAKEYAYKTVALEVEGMLRTGEIWFSLKKSGPEGGEWDQYDPNFFRSDYEAFKNGEKTKDDIIKDVLKRVYRTGTGRGKTTEQYFMEQYDLFAGGK